MSTNNTAHLSKPLWIGVLLFALALVVTVGIVVRQYGPGNMGNGVLAGGGVTILALAVVIWRVSRRPGSATTLERAWTRQGDERDDAVLTRSLAVVGLAAPVLAAAVTITLSLGAPMAPVLAVFNFAFIALFAASFAWTNRRS